MFAHHRPQYHPSKRSFFHKEGSPNWGTSPMHACYWCYQCSQQALSVTPRPTSLLQEFNPMPFAAMILNHTGWVVYAVINTDWFIFSAESTGLLCGIWVTFSLFPLSTEKVFENTYTYTYRLFCFLRTSSTLYRVHAAHMHCCMQMQNRLSGLVVVAGLMYCVLALITMILNTVSPSKVNLMW